MMKHHWIAAVLSALLPGSGQFLKRDWMKGGIFFALAMVVSGMLRRGSALSVSFPDGSMMHVLLILFLLGLAVWSAADALRSHPHDVPHHQAHG